MNYGEIMEVGNHVLMCGDSTKKEDVDKLVDHQKVDMVFTDPPYAILGSSTGMKSDVADDNMIKPFFRCLGSNIGSVVKLTGHVYIMCDWRTYPLIREEMEQYLELKNLIVWVKGAAGPQGSMYANIYENIAFFVKQSETISMYADFRNKGSPKQRTVYEPNVWDIKRVPIEERKHFAQKPIELIRKAIKNSTDDNDIVFDPFLGSGTTLMACQQMGRRCYAMEINPKYCDIVLERYNEIILQTHL